MTHSPPRFLVALSLVVLAACGSSNDVTRAPRPLLGPEHRAGTDAPAPLASGRLPAIARPRHYALSLVIDPKKSRFSGDVAIDVEVLVPTRSIVLHGRDLTLVRAEALVGGAYIPVEVHERGAEGGKGEPEELVLELARPISPGPAQLRLAYSAPLQDRLTGLYRVGEGDDFYAFTQFQPTDARRVFPCFDEPEFKVPFDVKVTTPAGNSVFANAPAVEQTTSDDGRSVTVAFATTPPLPTYLIAFAVGPLEVRESEGGSVPLRLITTKGKARLGETALETAREHVDLLAKYFDRPYPFPKLDLVAVPEFGYGAMENAGLVSFREERILLDPRTASTRERRQMALTLAHEISHHWFGNFVTLGWWDDLWLNEGFATWLEAKIVDEWRAGQNARVEALSDKDEAMSLDALDSARAVRRPVRSTSDAEEAFDGIVYDKGAAILGMLEQWMGPETFRDGVRAFVAQHEYGTATSADLFQALSVASGREVWPIASTFLDQSGVPLVRAELQCPANAPPRVALRQSRLRARPSSTSEAGDTAWRIPVCVAYDGDRGTPACAVLDGPTASVQLAGERCPKWIHPNADEVGYFRYALQPDAFRALVRAHKSLSPAARVGLPANLWALVQSGDVEPELLMALLAELARSKDPLLLEHVAAVLVEVNDTIIDETSRPKFKRLASSMLLPAAKELGWTARRRDDDDDRLLRRNLLSALSTLSDDPWMRAEADKLTKSYLADPTQVDGDTAAIALRVSARHGTPEDFQRLVRALANADAPRERLVALGALSAFEDSALLARALDLILSGDVRKQDAFYLIRGATAWPEARSAVLSWLESRFPEVRQRLPGFILTRFLDGLDHVCDVDSERRIAALLEPGMRDIEGADRRLMQVLERGRLCIAFRARSADSVKRALSAAR